MTRVGIYDKISQRRAWVIVTNIIQSTTCNNHSPLCRSPSDIRLNVTLAGVFKAFDSPMVDNKLWNIHKMIPITLSGYYQQSTRVSSDYSTILVSFYCIKNDQGFQAKTPYYRSDRLLVTFLRFWPEMLLRDYFVLL